MKRTWQAVGVIAGAAGLVLGGMGLAVATGDDPPSKKEPSSLSGAAQAAMPPDPGQTVFTPITPCRIVDTRASGKVGTAGRSFYVGGTDNFPAQGGKSGGCGIPAGASAIAANLVAVNASGSGFLKAFPAGSAAPSASVLNYGTAALANELPLTVRPGTSTGLTVTASSPTNLLVDVTGYYSPQIEAFVFGSGSVFSSTSAVTSVTRTDTGSYTVTIDRDVNTCAATVSVGTSGGYAAASSGGTNIFVTTWTLPGGTFTPTDRAFNLVVTC